ncbi:major capsid protein [Streptomyces sp. NPDC006540]|uniref:major capsid protein n=1 Tax=Streptomyces sp. NPDC006540 TaxID=3155353 RepID=UPI0033A6AFDB
MALTLPQAAVLSEDDLQRGVLETFVQESPVLDRIPFLTIEGNAYAYNKEEALPGVAFRSVNNGYVESTGTFVQDSEALVILGGDADVDRFIAKTRGNLNDQRAAQTRLKVKALSYFFQDKFINGDVAGGDTNGFDGLKTRLAGSQVISAGTNGLPVLGADAAASNAFFDKLDELVAAVPGLNGSNGALYANRSVLAKIRSAGRRIGGVEIIKEDITGKRVLTWNGIAFLDIGQKPDGSNIIPQTETQGSSSVASSIYAVKFGGDEGDRAVTGLTNGGVQVYDLGEMNDKPVYRTRIEFYTGLATFGGQAAARLTGVLAS